MKTVSISGSLRENVGKKDAKQCRRQNQVPCVLYGGKEQITFKAHEDEFKDLVYSPDAHLVNLSINGQEIQAVLQAIQFHPVTDKILHVDFLQIFPDKPVVIQIPVKIEGNSVGVRSGGKLLLKMRKLKVKALPANLPDYITLDITNLEVGQAIKVGDIVKENLQLLDNKNNIVVMVRSTRAVAENAEGAPAATGEAKPAAK